MRVPDNRVMKYFNTLSYSQRLPSVNAFASQPIIEILRNVHPEVYAAATMALPSIVSFLWIFQVFSKDIHQNKTLMGKSQTICARTTNSTLQI